MDADQRAIGVFDSGLGGLTVVRELIRQMPHENIVYFGDTARVPYGTKSRESIIQFSKENTKALLKHKVKMVVVACNSSSSHALPSLKSKFRLPIVGVIHPGAQGAAEATRNNRIGVVATQATVKSDAYRKAIKKYRPRAKVYSQACSLFVPLAEEGWFNKKVTLEIAREYLKPLRKSKVDTLILGCTHYPLLKKTVKKAIGSKVTLIDSAEVVAREVKQQLKERKQLRKSTAKGKYKFLITDRPQEFKKIAKNFLGCNMKTVTKVA